MEALMGTGFQKQESSDQGAGTPFQMHARTARYARCPLRVTIVWACENKSLTIVFKVILVICLACFFINNKKHFYITKY